MTDTNETKQEEIFEIKDLKIGQTGKYNQFRGNSIDDGRRLLFISFDNEYCCVVTDTEWNTIKFGDFRKLKVTDLFISKQLHDKSIKIIRDRFDMWEASRGGYILSQEYRDELKEYIFTGKSKGLGKYKEVIKDDRYK